MDTRELMIGLSFLSPLFLIAGLILGLTRYRKLDGKHRLILWYLSFALLTDVLSRYWSWTQNNNLVFLSITGIIDLLFIARLYLKYFLPKNWGFLVYPTALILLTVLFNIAFYNNQLAATFQSYDKLFCNLTIVGYCLICFLDILKRKKNNREVMRVNAAVLLYFSVDILISMTSNFLINEALHLVVYFWLLRLLLLLYMYLVLIQTLWQTGKNRKHWQFG
jgi:hypothetical protein